MVDIPAWQVALYGAALVAIVVVGSRWLAGEQSAAPASRGAAAAREPAIRLDDGTTARLVVHVAGAVRRPGVYRLRSGSRVVDAVRRAGGASPRAELSQLNLAAKLEDGKQVLVPERAALAGGAGSAPVAAGTAPAPGVPLNLNTATVEQLDTLDGIGPAMARKIIAYRTAHNGFRAVEELGEVPGIGAKRLAGLREQVRV